jgi:predicted cupin superfamily sugar epimerase
MQHIYSGAADIRRRGTGRRSFMQRMAMLGAAVLCPGVARAQAPSNAVMSGGGAAMTNNLIDDMTFDDVRKLLDLTPNATCGYVRVTFISQHKIAAGGMQAPFADGRPAGSALYFMLTPQEPVKLHRIRNDQLYHYYLGDPIEVLMMLQDGSTQFHVVGPDLRKGHTVQLLIPGGTFHTARIIGGRRWFLGASTEWPGVEPKDVELGNADALAAKYPKVASDIRSFPVPAKP